MKEQNQSTLSLSQQRRLDRKKAAVNAKKAAKRNKIIAISVVTVISLAILILIGDAIYKNAIKVKPTDNFSGQLNDDGTITGVTATDYVTLPEYLGISVPSSTVTVSDDDVTTVIKTTLDGLALLDETAGLLIEDGDKINLDYVGKVAGVEFEGGSTDGAGSDLTIGSNTFVDDFEQQLIGKAVGEEVLIEVTFPDDYHNTEMAGKDATFDVVINGIYANELTDEIVKENFSDVAQTATEYFEYVRNDERDKKLGTFLQEYFDSNVTVANYPKKYIEQLKSLNKFQAISQFEYYQQYYAAIGYGNMTFEDYFSQSEEEFDVSLHSEAEKSAKFALIYQAIAENEGIVVTAEELETEEHKTNVEQYGKGSVAQSILFNKVLDFIKEKAIVL